MARWMEPNPEQLKAWEDWVAQQPPVVQEAARRFPIYELFALKKNGSRVYVVGFEDHEDGTVTAIAQVSAQFNLVVLERTVFGIPLEDLTPCDLPAAEDAVGTLEDMIDAGIAREDGKVN